jgi:hypothetical protein
MYHLINRIRILGKLNFIFLLFLLNTPAFSQDKDSSYNGSAYKYWMTVGMFVENYKGITFDADYSFSIGDNFYKVGYLSKGSFWSDSPSEEGQHFFRSINISIGKRFLTEWFQASLFCGPSYVYGNSYNNDSFNAIGLATQVQLLFRLADEIGIGVGMQGNLNFVKNFGAIYVNISLGNGK